MEGEKSGILSYKAGLVFVGVILNLKPCKKKKKKKSVK